MSRSFNIWPKWAKNIEEVRILCPQPWQMSTWDKDKRRDWFHAADGLAHHPWYIEIEGSVRRRIPLPWWKLVTVKFSPHTRYKQKICHLMLENPTIGWNIWVYFRNGGAVCFELNIVRGLPRALKKAE